MERSFLSNPFSQETKEATHARRSTTFSAAARNCGPSVILKVRCKECANFHRPFFRVFRKARVNRKVVTKHIPPVENSHIQNTDIYNLRSQNCRQRHLQSISTHPTKFGFGTRSCSRARLKFSQMVLQQWETHARTRRIWLTQSWER